MSLVIEAKGLTRVYRGARRRAAIRAVDGVDLEVAQGETLGLLGPNGAGKTTIVRMLACILRPTDGTARIAGHDIHERRREVRAACGLSMESPGLYERLTAREYLTFFARLYDVAEGRIPARLEEQLRAALLWDRRDDLLATFSKGMRQKMNIARALVHHPRLVFLDEPTSGLDVEAATTVREHIRDMSRDAETTFVICTHNLSEAERLSDRIALMKAGRIVAVGAPDELKRRVPRADAFRIRLRQVLPHQREAVASVPGVAAVEVEDNVLVVHIPASKEQVTREILRRLAESGADVVSFGRDDPSLEDAYLHLLRQDAEKEGGDG